MINPINYVNILPLKANNMHTPDRIKVLLNHLNWNISHLKEILKNSKTIYYRDASIQRFRFAFDLALKCIKAQLDSQEEDYSEIEDWFFAAQKIGCLDDTGNWSLAVEDYQLIKNGFQNTEGEKVYENLIGHLFFFQRLHDNLTNLALGANPQEPTNDK